MKALFISNLYPPVVLGGYEILCEYVAGKFMEYGHKIIVLTSDDNTEGVFAGERGRYNERIVRRLKLIQPFSKAPKRARVRHGIVERFNYHRSLATIRKEKPDIVFFWSQRRLTLGAIRAATKAQVAIAVTFNDEFPLAYRPPAFKLSPKPLASFFLDRTLFRRNTDSGVSYARAMVISEGLKEKLLHAGVRAEALRVIHQGVDTSLFQMKKNKAVPRKAFRLLYTGQLHEYKGVHTILEAMALLRNEKPTFTLTIVGDGDKAYIRKLQRLAASLGLEKSVEFAGKKQREALPEIYQAHDIFIFPSIWKEPFGLTHLEAMACGLPLVATTEGGTGEFLLHEENGLAFTADDAASLAKQLRRLTEDKALFYKLVQNGRALVENHFNAERYTKDIEAFLQETIAMVKGS